MLIVSLATSIMPDTGTFKALKYFVEWVNANSQKYGNMELHIYYAKGVGNEEQVQARS